MECVSFVRRFACLETNFHVYEQTDNKFSSGIIKGQIDGVEYDQKVT